MEQPATNDQPEQPAAETPPSPTTPTAPAPTQATERDQQFAALLADLTELRAYLDERGNHTYEMAQRFTLNARRDASSRAYDERQATMLEYQHYIWREIAGRVGQILARYEDEADDDE